MREAIDGLLVLDKPGGMTSRAAVNRAVKWFPRRTRVGHTGTLDPLATGVLVLTLGKATRLAEYVQAMTKTYRAGIRLGARSDSDDADGVLTPVPGATPPDATAVEQCLMGFVGVIEQLPPAFSALKVAGRRAYDAARGGEAVSLQPRPVRIDQIDLRSYSWPELEIEVVCGKGTYIRSLARDIGDRLGCGGYIRLLRRTRVGVFTTEMGISLETDAATARARVRPILDAVSELGRVQITEEATSRLCLGQAVPLSAILERVGVAQETTVAVLTTTGELAAIGTIDNERGLLRPEKVLMG
jgi:tRNA pseudouridine55 synthase